MSTPLRNRQSCIGLHVEELPTPVLLISKPIVERNIAQLHQDVDSLGLTLRPHVKTLKTLEITRMLLGTRSKKIVASTLAEVRGSLPLAEEGLLDEVLYGLPINKTALAELSQIREHVDVVLLIDHEQHIDLIEGVSYKKPWKVFIKIDVGSKRAGVPPSSARLPALVKRTLASPSVSLSGFYCHAGHSYACKTTSEAEDVLRNEIEGVLYAASLVPPMHSITVSIGSTPTAHVVKSIKAAAPPNVAIELHAGNFPTNDLQQVSTGLVSEDQQAIRIQVEVSSVYPERNEALVNAGTIALSKETSAFPGFGNVVEKPAWYVGRMSQEHGILVTDPGNGQSAEEEFRVGDKLRLYCAHSCITAAAFPEYYVVDEHDRVSEVWIPWKWW